MAQNRCATQSSPGRRPTDCERNRNETERCHVLVWSNLVVEASRLQLAPLGADDQHTARVVCSPPSDFGWWPRAPSAASAKLAAVPRNATPHSTACMSAAGGHQRHCRRRQQLQLDIVVKNSSCVPGQRSSAGGLRSTSFRGTRSPLQGVTAAPHPSPSRIVV